MRTIVVILAVAMTFALPRVSAKDRDVCALRSDLVARVALQRDKGVSKAQMKTAMVKAMPQFPSWLIDFIWDNPHLSAKQIAAKDLELCLKTP